MKTKQQQIVLSWLLLIRPISPDSALIHHRHCVVYVNIHSRIVASDFQLGEEASSITLQLSVEQHEKFAEHTLAASRVRSLVLCNSFIDTTAFHLTGTVSSYVTIPCLVSKNVYLCRRLEYLQ